jgi:hypothetical protein
MQNQDLKNWQEHKRGRHCEGEGEKRGLRGCEYNQSTLYRGIKMESWNLLNIIIKWRLKGKSERVIEGEFDQSTLLACSDIPQWSPFVQFINIH